MTNLEALQATIAGYPLATNAYSKALTDRGVSSTGTYAGITEAFELARADLYVMLATGVNISEGGYSISISERKTFLDIANSIYQKWEYPSMGSGALKVKAVQPW